MRKTLFIIVFVLLVGLFLPRMAFAQETGGATCDACGRCANNTDVMSASGQKNWESCVQCLYSPELYPEDNLNTEEIIAKPEIARSLMSTLDPPPGTNSVFTVFGCVQMANSCDEEADPGCSAKVAAGSFASFFMNFITITVSGLAFLGILFGGLKIMLARGDKDAVGEGKRYVYGAILGLLVVVFSVFIIRTIGFTILGIPYFE